MKRVTAPISAEIAPDAPISGANSIGVAAHCASAAITAVRPMNPRKLAAMVLRATGGPKATSQTVFSST